MRRTILSSRFIGRLVIVALSATLAATLAVAAFTSTGAAQATKTLEGVKGFHRGGGHPTYEYMDYPNPGPSNLDNDFPLLKTFTFQFVPSYKACVPEVTGNCFDQVDHHIHDIAIDPHID